MIEDIILSGKSKISKLRKYLPKNYCEKSAEYILKNSKRTIIVTGFYVDGKCDSDGISGAIHLAEILKSFNSEVNFITEDYCVSLLKKISNFSVIDYNNNAEKIIEQFKPTLVIYIERCGKTKNGKYYNIHGRDISSRTSDLDIFAKRVKHSVAIGDGGNEIGMGNLYKQIKKEKIMLNPSITKVNHLVIASTSDWGCYGLIAYLSKKTNNNFLENLKINNIAKKLYKFGALDGITKKRDLTIDGYSISETQDIIDQLKRSI